MVTRCSSNPQNLYESGGKQSPLPWEKAAGAAACKYLTGLRWGKARAAALTHQPSATGRQEQHCLVWVSAKGEFWPSLLWEEGDPWLLPEAAGAAGGEQRS